MGSVRIDWQVAQNQLDVVYPAHGRIRVLHLEARCCHACSPEVGEDMSLRIPQRDGGQWKRAGSSPAQLRAYHAGLFTLGPSA
jgi:hypothetical protein